MTTITDTSNTGTLEVQEGVAGRVARAVNRLLGSPLPVVVPDPVQDVQPEPKGSAEVATVLRRQWEEFFVLASNRAKRYKDYDRMDTGDVAVQLDDIVDACTIADDGRLFGFGIRAGAKVKNLIEDTINRNNLTVFVREALRGALKYGDEFVSITLNDNADITYLQGLPAGTMLARVDNHMRLKKGTDPIGEGKDSPRFPAAYWQVDSQWKVVDGWFPWEMCHLKYRPTRKSAYSATSMIEDIRPRWHKLRMMEEAMTIGRMLRAYPRNVHYVDVTGMTPEDAHKYVLEYLDRIKKTKMASDTTSGSRGVETKLWGVDEDLVAAIGYIQAPDGTSQPMLSKIDVIDPQAVGIRHIPDVEYMQRGIHLRTSAELVGIPGDREDVSLQDIASSRFYQWCQKGILERQLLRPIFDLALFLKGYDPKPTAYELVWPKVIIESSWRFADAGFRRSMEDNNQTEGFLCSRKYKAVQRFGFTDEQWAEQVAEMEAEQKVFGPIDRGTKAQMTRIGNQAT